MKLIDLAVRSTLIVTSIGLIYHGCDVLFIKSDYSQITPPYGVFAFNIVLAFWLIFYCITPKDWWK